MTDVAIRVENLGKLYRIGERQRYLALRDVLARTLSAPARLFGGKTPRQHPESNQLWAVKDVSFEIRRGDVVGILGRNGAGKSTLLKILARVTKPTSGFADVHGRMGTLLEVGTGFHSELTGRENVFMSGAILGMCRAEIRSKFDEIVAFSEVEKFIDTPIKHYSSGMQMRLAFAVAAHLEPEILLVDEVLAVGDAAFQKKCLGKMGEVARRGRTILFVSHNLAAVSTLCHNAILLSSGRVAEHGPTQSVIAAYAEATDIITGQFDLTSPRVRRTGDRIVSFVAARLMDGEGNEISAAAEGKAFQLELSVVASGSADLSILSVTLVDQFDNDLWTTMHYDSLNLKRLDPGGYRFTIDVNPNFLASGKVQVRLACFGPHFHEYDHIHNAFVIAVAPSPESADTLIRRPGTVYLPSEWRMQKCETLAKGTHTLEHAFR